MIIGYDAKRLFCNDSGLGTYARTFVKNLAEQHPEFNIHLFTPCTRRREETEFFFKAPNIKIHHAQFFGAFWRTFLIPILAQRYRLDVFHGLSNELPIFSFLSKTKKILTVHDVIFRSHAEGYTFFDRMIYNLKLKWALRSANEIICISHHTRAELEKYYNPRNTKISVIHPSINKLYAQPDTWLKSSEFQSLYNLRNGFWLYVGSLHKRKNLKVLFKALTLIPPHRQKNLVIVTKDKISKIRVIPNYFDSSDRIRIENDLSDRVLSLFYKNCTALIYPSLAEGFGLPILEAIAHGATVVCADNPAHREAGGESVYYFKPNNADELANILSKLSYQDKKSSQLAFSHVKLFDAKRTNDQLLAVYQKY